MNLDMTELEKIETADGSTCLRNRFLKVLYRSDGGARTESEDIFIRGTRITEKKKVWKIMELGFGGACNFIALAEKSQNCGVQLDYRSVDNALIPPEMVTGESTGAKLAREVLSKCRATGQVVQMNWGNLSLQLHPYHWKNVMISNFRADAFFFDPFAPDVNPECWTADCFKWVRKHITVEAIMSTYSAQGKMRRAMAEAGFFVARGPGSGEKRESTLASPSEHTLIPFKLKYRP